MARMYHTIYYNFVILYIDGGYVNKKFILLYSNSQAFNIIISEDGRTWVQGNPPTEYVGYSRWYSTVTNNSLVFWQDDILNSGDINKYDIYTTQDGITWTKKKSITRVLPDKSLSGLSYNPETDTIFLYAMDGDGELTSVYTFTNNDLNWEYHYNRITTDDNAKLSFGTDITYSKTLKEFYVISNRKIYMSKNGYDFIFIADLPTISSDGKEYTAISSGIKMAPTKEGVVIITRYSPKYCIYNYTKENGFVLLQSFDDSAYHTVGIKTNK